VCKSHFLLQYLQTAVSDWICGTKLPQHAITNYSNAESVRNSVLKLNLSCDIFIWYSILTFWVSFPTTSNLLQSKLWIKKYDYFSSTRSMLTLCTNFNKHGLDQLFHQLNPKPNLTPKYILAMNLPTVET
jgi:hypothetical protein